MIDSRRPQGYKAKPPVDLRRKVPKVGRRVPFIDPEDLTLATLAGPHGLRNLLLEVDKEITELRREVHRICGKHVHKISQHHVSTQECKDSPFGLCCFEHSPEMNPFTSCIFCNQLPN